MLYLNVADNTTPPYKQFVFSVFSQYSAQLGAIILSSLVAISTGFMNKITTTVTSMISGSSASSKAVSYLNNLVSNQKIWQQLVGDGITAIQGDSAQTTWTNFYISFSTISNFIDLLNPSIIFAAQPNALAWCNANLGSINNLLLVLSSSSLSSVGFFCYDGSQYYLLLPDGAEYGWLIFNTGTSYLANANNNNNLNLIIKGTSSTVIESVQTAFMKNGVFSEQIMSNVYTLNFFSPLIVSTSNPKVSNPNLLSFSYFNQFLGLTMTIHNVSNANGVMYTFKDGNGRGISITRGGCVTFID